MLLPGGAGIDQGAVAETGSEGRGGMDAVDVGAGKQLDESSSWWAKGGVGLCGAMNPDNDLSVGEKGHLFGDAQLLALDRLESALA